MKSNFLIFLGVSKQEWKERSIEWFIIHPRPYDHLLLSVLVQKNSTTLPVHNIKGFNHIVNHVEGKGGVNCDTNREFNP